MFRCFLRTGRLLRCFAFGFVVLISMSIYLFIASLLFTKQTTYPHNLDERIKRHLIDHPVHGYQENHHPDDHNHNNNNNKNAHLLSLNNATIVRSGGRIVNNLFKQGEKVYDFKFPSLTENQLDKFPIFPFETNDIEEDRIWNQMRYIPKQLVHNKTKVKEKIILFYNGMGVEVGGKIGLVNNNCPVKECQLTGDRSLFNKADVVLWQYSVSSPFRPRPPNQIWAVFYIESPHHTPGFTLPDINWTMTYMHDSTVVTPYYKYTPYDMTKSKFTGPFYLPKRNYASGKTKKIAWFVSNCGAPNQRSSYVAELAKYIEVDIFGACGTRHCPRSDENACFRMLNKDYKFYLSFENSNCRDYITEKLFKNGLQNDIVPVVMGAHPDDYRRQAPFHSFIHIDEFESPKELAEYLHYLDKNETAYNTYFSWKGNGLVDTNTFFICRLCMMAHEADNIPYTVKDPNTWWHNSCTKDRWIKAKSLSEHIDALNKLPFFNSTMETSKKGEEKKNK